MKPNTCSSDIDSLKVFSLFFLIMVLIINLKTELPTYLSKAEDVSSIVSKTKWWRDHVHELPFWSSTCKSILLIFCSYSFSLLAI